MSDQNFQQAKTLLLGAVENVIQIADRAQVAPNNPPRSSWTGLQSFPSTSGIQPQTTARTNAACVSEHKRLFGFRPSTDVMKKKASKKKPGKSTYRKDCICLKDIEHSWKPSPEDKMDLAKIGLGLKTITFNSDGDANHVHSLLLSNFPALENCGGYTLLRLGGSSKNLVEIESPAGGITVFYLKDILNQAKLYVRPLQRNITEEDMKSFAFPKREEAEPTEFCQTCCDLFPLSQLRRHVALCKPDVVTISDSKEEAKFEDPTPSKRLCLSHENTDSLINSAHQQTTMDISYYPLSPKAPIPEPISPIIKERKYGSTTYSSYIHLISDDEEEWEKDPVIQEVLQQSTQSNNQSLHVKTIAEIILDHKRKFLYSDMEMCQRITVRRCHIFDDTIAALRRGFDEQKHLKVAFIGEAAVDDGGPRREFFVLLMGAVANNGSLLDGPPDYRVLRHNTSALQDELFLMVGKIIALSIIHGGPGPVFFAQSVIDYIFGGIANVTARIQDIPDLQIQSLIQQLAIVDDETKFQEMLGTEEYDFRYTCGVAKPSCCITLAEKKKIIDAFCLHYSVLVSLAELEQLRRGLSIQRFDSLLESYPEIMYKAFQPPDSPLTSTYIQDLFVPLLSPRGSNSRESEEAIIMSWIHYLQNLEDGNGPAMLKDVLMFLTGCDCVPPLGFGDVDPCILFSADIQLPTVSTCALTLHFPITFPTDNETFKEKMDLCVLGSQGFFGQV